MCEPTTIAAGLSIASSVSGFMGQRQQAKEQESYNNRQYEAAIQNRNDNLAYSNAEQEQERQNTAQRLDQTNKAVVAQQATARVAAGEAGVSGMSVDALLADIGGQGGDANTATISNYLRGSQRIAQGVKNINNQTSSTINQLRTPNKPDVLGTALKIGTAVYDYQNPRGGR